MNTQTAKWSVSIKPENGQDDSNGVVQPEGVRRQSIQQIRNPHIVSDGPISRVMTNQICDWSSYITSVD